ncbi:MAG: hypothetical protein Ct9H300mP12_03480 [Acidimicrobiales bacterium]|nr:MAG: hypothetical protein Ct9H300mP12_03480 [Acidimicrobiales bacterium]
MSGAIADMSDLSTSAPSWTSTPRISSSETNQSTAPSIFSGFSPFRTHRRRPQVRLRDQKLLLYDPALMQIFAAFKPGGPAPTTNTLREKFSWNQFCMGYFSTYFWIVETSNWKRC